MCGIHGLLLLLSRIDFIVHSLRPLIGSWSNSQASRCREQMEYVTHMPHRIIVIFCNSYEIGIYTTDSEVNKGTTDNFYVTTRYYIIILE